MSDLAIKFVQFFLRTYGIWTAVAIVALAATVWVLVHDASAPGTEVKVLWGLVEYTKTAPIDSQPTTITSGNRNEPTTETSSSSLQVSKKHSPSVETTMTVPIDPQPTTVTTGERTKTTSETLPSLPGTKKHFNSISLAVAYGLTSETYVQHIETIRFQHNLRKIRTIESDRPLKDSAPGTYSFVFAPSVELWVDRNDFLGARSNWRKRLKYGVFEVHHRKDNQFILIAFVSESDGDRIRTLDGKIEYGVTIAPTLWKQFSTIIELPIGRIITADNRSLDIGGLEPLLVLDLTVR